jgi:hypothetical protein
MSTGLAPNSVETLTSEILIAADLKSTVNNSDSVVVVRVTDDIPTGKSVATGVVGAAWFSGRRDVSGPRSSSRMCPRSLHRS